jgi:hypothetical protein
MTDKKQKATNTENDPKPEWLFGMNPGAIEDQEAKGQRELVESSQLPRVCNSPRGLNAAEQYHKMGIKVFTSSKGDDLFLGVKLPEGWKKEATEHSMWNKLIDDKGRCRAMFFYKAAFYDRDAFVNFQTRYYWKTNFGENKMNSCQVVDRATGEVLFETEKMGEDYNNPDYFKNQEQQQKKCKDFLNETFPNHEDINAYWD